MAGKQKAKSDEPEILEGEVIEEVTDAPDESASEPTSKPENRKNAKASFSRRISWLLLAFMAVFVTGLFVAPWAETTLRAWLPDGWMPQEEPVAASVQIEELNLLTGRLEALERRTNIGERSTADLSTDVAMAQSRGASRDAELAALSERIAALSTQVDLASTGDLPALDTSGLEARIAALEARPQQTADGVPGIAPDRLALLESEIAALKSERDALNASIAALAEAAEQGGRPQAANVANLSLAISAIAHPLQEGLPYIIELSAARGAADTLEEPWRRRIQLYLNGLAKGEGGILTRGELLRDFQSAMSAALAAERAGGENSGWMERLWDSVTGVVKVRRVGEVDGDDAQSVLARAEVRIQAGDLGDAVDELSGLTGPAAEAMAAWETDAMLRLDLDLAFNQLTAEIVRLAQAPRQRADSP